MHTDGPAAGRLLQVEAVRRPGPAAQALDLVRRVGDPRGPERPPKPPPVPDVRGPGGPRAAPGGAVRPGQFARSRLPLRSRLFTETPAGSVGQKELEVTNCTPWPGCSKAGAAGPAHTVVSFFTRYRW